MRHVAVGFFWLGLGTLSLRCSSSENASNAATSSATSSATGSSTATGGAAGSAATTSTTSGMSGAGGTAGGGSTAGTGGSGGSGGHPTGSGTIPVPPGPGNVPRPTGSAANLKVIAWAGFKAAVTYTFDDSQPSQIDHYADLKATGVPVTYYITTVNSYYAGYDTTWKDALARGSELGNHTVNHCYFDSSCPQGGKALATPEAEIDGATDYLKTKLGAPDVYTMAYPFGDAAYAADARTRFFLGRIAGPGTTGGMVGPSDATDPFSIPVIAAAGGEAASKFSGDVDRARTQGKWLIFLFHSLLPDAQNWYAGVDIAAVTDSIAHAKSSGDVWLDTLANVGAYWLGQKTVEAAMPMSAGGAMTWAWTLPGHFPPGRILRVTVDGGTLRQGAAALPWDGHGYYEIALDAGTLSWSP